VLTIVAAQLLMLAWLRFAGSLLLLWIGIKLLSSDEEQGGQEHPMRGLWGAIRTILIADFVMSLDNVLGVAAAAHGNILLLTLGLVISIPLIVFGSTLILKVMDRFPALVSVGAGLIGYVAGEMILEDPALAPLVPHEGQVLARAVPIVAAAVVIAAGHLLAARARRGVPVPQHVIDLDHEQKQ
jgi:YjbE family integral membrane protein